MIATDLAVGYANSSAVAKSDGASDELGKDDFLNLFVTQLQNQDPLQPMDNTQFLSQMAQFSSLEQMQNIAGAMELLTLSQSAATNSQMISLIGKRIVHPGNTFSLEQGKTVDLSFTLPEDCPALKLNIYNQNGELVRTIEPTGLATGYNRYQFDGLDEQGQALSSGVYEYKFVAADGSDSELDIEYYSNLLVDSVAFGSDSTILKAGGLSIQLADILEVRSDSQEQ